MALAPGQRLRVVREVLRQPDGPARRIWAVNGHAFPIGGAAGELIAQELTVGRELTLAELCRAVGADERNAAVTALLRKLYRLRAIELTESAESSEPSESSESSGSAERAEDGGVDG